MAGGVAREFFHLDSDVNIWSVLFCRYFTFGVSFLIDPELVLFVVPELVFCKGIHRLEILFVLFSWGFHRAFPLPFLSLLSILPQICLTFLPSLPFSFQIIEFPPEPPFPEP